MQISDAIGTAALHRLLQRPPLARSPQKNPSRVCGGSRVSPRSSVKHRFLGFHDRLDHGVKDLDEAALHQFHNHRLRPQNVDNMSNSLQFLLN